MNLCNVIILATYQMPFKSIQETVVIKVFELSIISEYLV